MGTSVRKMYDAELLQLDTMLARMGHAAGGAIESAMTALRSGDTELAAALLPGTAKSTPPSMRSSTAA